MSEFGLTIGVALLGLVALVAFLLARKAQSSVEQFREEHHERFTGREEGQ
ncbi:MAG: hypothetical protein HYY24_24845 [Verrucomicrobia bacterium]|nr:hypothetical protein [Verrucomicrobiota bacterium]